MVDTAGEALFRHVKNTLENANLSLKDCIGFCSDGASNMIGCNNSLWSRIKAESPDCIRIPCVCHSLALAAEKAFECLPSSIGHLLSEIPSCTVLCVVRPSKICSMLSICLQKNITETSLPSPKTSNNSLAGHCKNYGKDYTKLA